MALTIVGSSTATGATPSVPAHVAGDYIFVFAFRDNSNTAPTLPTGWTNIRNGGTNVCSERAGYRVATAPGTAGGTWTDATHTVCVVVRGIDGISGSGQSGGAYNSFYWYSAYSEASRALIFGGQGRVASTDYSAAPTGYTNVTADTRVCAHISDSGVTVTDEYISIASVSGTAKFRTVAVGLIESVGGSAQDITGASFTDSEAFGAGTVTPGPVAIVGSGFTDAEAFGAGAVSASYTITGASFADSETFGAGAFSGVITITGAGFTDAATFGAGVVSASYTITGVGFTDTETFGAGLVSLDQVVIQGLSFTDPETFGSGAFSTTQVITGTPPDQPERTISILVLPRELAVAIAPRAVAVSGGPRNVSIAIEPGTQEISATSRTITI